MPHAHLIVDGYNVTKRAWPELTLAEQRDRLVRELARLACPQRCRGDRRLRRRRRTGPAARARGVRVLFSPPGTIADEVIRQLVAAEPTGRVVLVATADREIIEPVLRRAARTCPTMRFCWKVCAAKIDLAALTELNAPASVISPIARPPQME